MTTVLIILLIVGALLFTASFFMQEDKVEEVVNVPLSSIEGRSLSGYEEDKIKEHIRTIMEEETANVLSEAEDRMGRISNEKIIAVNEFSEDLLAKIENNNEEVVFLYNMLKQKEDEMKSTLERVEALKQVNQALSKQIQADTSFGTSWISEDTTNLQKKETVYKAAGEEAENEAAENLPKKTQEAGGSGMHKSPHMNLKMQNPFHKAGQKTMHADKNQESGHEKAVEILALHKQELSVMEIAKKLSLGQSEVKLVIDLYGN